MSWAHPWNRPAYMGPRRDCMWARTLCSMYPTTMGADKNTISTRIALMSRMTQKLLNRLSTKETPAVAITRSLLLFLLAFHRARPHLGPPGHQREVLPHGMTLERL